MKDIKNKIMLIIYTALIFSLAIGWNPVESSSQKVCSYVKNTSVSLKAVCALGENDRLFTQNVVETAKEERKRNEQIEKQQESKVTVVKEKKAKPAISTSVSGKNILERIVEAEAGDQDIKGRILVANVILNRVRSGSFPDSIKAVVFAHNQFSPVSNGSYYRVRVSRTTKRAVERALSGEDLSKGALYFMCRSASNPDNVRWFDRDLKRLFAYGCHEFFR